MDRPDTHWNISIFTKTQKNYTYFNLCTWNLFYSWCHSALNTTILFLVSFHLVVFSLFIDLISSFLVNFYFICLIGTDTSSSLAFCTSFLITSLSTTPSPCSFPLHLILCALFSSTHQSLALASPLRTYGMMDRRASGASKAKGHLPGVLRCREALGPAKQPQHHTSVYTHSHVHTRTHTRAHTW